MLTDRQKIAAIIICAGAPEPRSPIIMREKPGDGVTPRSPYTAPRSLGPRRQR